LNHAQIDALNGKIGQPAFPRSRLTGYVPDIKKTDATRTGHVAPHTRGNKPSSVDAGRSEQPASRGSPMREIEAH
jgi:hypothetical protein